MPVYNTAMSSFCFLKRHVSKMLSDIQPFYWIPQGIIEISLNRWCEFKKFSPVYPSAFIILGHLQYSCLLPGMLVLSSVITCGVLQNEAYGLFFLSSCPQNLLDYFIFLVFVFARIGRLIFCLNSLSIYDSAHYWEINDRKKYFFYLCRYTKQLPNSLGFLLNLS